MSSSLNTMQCALIKAGLLSEDRATIVNTIEKDKQRRAAKQAAAKLSRSVGEVLNQPRKLNQNRKQPAQKVP